MRHMLFTKSSEPLAMVDVPDENLPVRLVLWEGRYFAPKETGHEGELFEVMPYVVPKPKPEPKPARNKKAK